MGFVRLSLQPAVVKTTIGFADALKALKNSLTAQSDLLRHEARSEAYQAAPQRRAQTTYSPEPDGRKGGTGGLAGRRMLSGQAKLPGKTAKLPVLPGWLSAQPAARNLPLQGVMVKGSVPRYRNPLIAAGHARSASGPRLRGDERLSGTTKRSASSAPP